MILHRTRIAVTTCLALLGSPALVATSSPGAAAAEPHRTRQVLGIFDGPDHWVFCRDRLTYRGSVDFAVGDPPRASWGRWVRMFERCAAAKQRIYLRYNHEIDGTWMPYSWKSPARFRKDYCDIKAYVRANVSPTTARKVKFALGLNLGTHRGRSQDWFTPCADVVAISMYEQSWLTWQQFLASRIGPEYWWRLTRANKCGAATDRPAAAQLRRLPACRLAFGEWGALTPRWLMDMRRWMDAHRVVYAAYLHHPGVLPWIHPASRT